LLIFPFILALHESHFPSTPKVAAISFLAKSFETSTPKLLLSFLAVTVAISFPRFNPVALAAD
jgi:hypothetical protein